MKTFYSVVTDKSVESVMEGLINGWKYPKEVDTFCYFGPRMNAKVDLLSLSSIHASSVSKNK